MNETELERMVVRLVGDSEQYRKMLEDAAKKTEETAGKLEAHANRIEKFEEGMKRYAAAAAELFMAHKAKDFLKDSLGEWDIAEKTAIKLSAALEANGREVESQLSAYQEWAAEQQKVTTIGDDTNLMLLKQAETFDLTGEKAQSAAEQAQALAAINDSSAESMMRMTAAMTKGDTETAMMFARMIPQLRGVKNEMEFVEKYNKLVASGQKVLTEEAKTFSGQMAQLNNDFGDFKEEIGQITSRVLLPFVGMLKEVVHWFQSLSEGWKIAIVTVTMLSAGVLTLSASVAALLPLLKMISTVGIFSTAGSMSAIAGIVALKAAVAVGLVYALAEAHKELSGMNADFAKLRQSEQLGKVLDARLDAIQSARWTDKLAGFQGIQDLQKRREMIGEELKKQESEVRGYSVRMAMAVDRYNEILSHTEDQHLRRMVGNDVELNDAKAESDMLTASYANAAKRLDELRQEMQKTEAQRSAVVEAALKDLVKEHDMIGMTNGQKRVRELLDKGVDERLLAEYKAQAALNDERQKAFEIEQAYGEKRMQEIQAIQDFITSMEREIETMGWSSEEKKYAALQTAYLTDEQRTYIRELMRGLEITRDQNKMMETIKETTRQFQTPLEEFTARQKELDEQLRNGLGVDTYNRALDAARKKFNDATSASDAFHSSVMKVNAVLAGSGAANEVVEEYVNRIRQQRPAVASTTVNQQGPVASQRQFTPAQQTFQGFDPSTPVFQLLKNIDRNTAKTAGNPPVTLKPANSGG